MDRTKEPSPCLIKRVILGICVLLVTVAVGYLLLVLAYSIPVGPMYENMVKSYDIFEKEGTYPIKVWNYNSRLDNFSDANMLLMASTEPGEDAWKAAVSTYTRSIGDLFPSEVLIRIYRDGVKDSILNSYARYWHGYLIFIKPLIYAVDYHIIRFVVGISQLLLMMILVYQAYKCDRRLIMPILVMYLFLNPVATLQSMLFNINTSIAIIMMIHIISAKRKQKMQNILIWDISFLLTGCATSYFDLLTFPLLTWGAPLIIWLYFNSVNEIKKNIGNEIELSAFWGLGYAGMWAFKWILGTMLTGKDIINNAVNEASGWSAASDAGRLRLYFEVLLRNCGAAVQISIVFCVLFMIVEIVKLFKQNKYDKKDVIIYLLLMISPFLWYFITVKHAFVHYWLTYRNMAISILSLNLILIYMRDRHTDNSEIVSQNESSDHY